MTGPWFAAPRRDAVNFAGWASVVRQTWEPRGFHVHVNTNDRRIVITPKATNSQERPT